MGSTPQLRAFFILYISVQTVPLGGASLYHCKCERDVVESVNYRSSTLLTGRKTDVVHKAIFSGREWSQHIPGQKQMFA